MNTANLNTIFEQISNLEKPVPESNNKKIEFSESDFKDVLMDISEEIQRVMDENDYTQEDLCRITGMSQSNISKIINGKVVPRMDTLQKIASATGTRLVISFESMEGDDE